MANIIYDRFKLHLGNDTIDLENDVFKCALLTDSHIPSAGYQIFTDVSSNEVSGAGYTAGGVQLTNTSWSEAGGIAYFDANNIQWSNATFTARYAVIYDDTTTFPSDVLMCMYDLNQNQFINKGTLTLTLHSQGIMKIQ